ncbi:hypothetical protein HHL28_14735 [Aerophototrophica crusticola]|uniref:Uncharacterized protein n=1 Tax=Aerophototrophica crusticola TaxID=1709002 RepID=A0A858R9L6_9PROT|nr:hypothetical protein HHL28_14735 [Rhodospirillaceae bacterium B3]
MSMGIQHQLNRPQGRTALPEAQWREAAGAAPVGMETGVAEAKPTKSGKDEGMSFWDLLDVVNPLQHIPLVNKAYQAITGDTIKPAAQMAGSALFFGPIGLAVAAADQALAHHTGNDAVGHLASVVGIDTRPGGRAAPDPAEDDPFTVTAPRPTQVAQADPAGLAQPIQARQVEELRKTPGASAAAMAAAGLPGAAAATLPSPGDGAEANVLAAMGTPAARESGPNQGKGLAQYRQAPVDGSVRPKPLLPSGPAQAATLERASVTPRPMAPNPAPQAPPQTAATDAAAEAPATQPQAWPPGGSAALPKELIADMMMMAMDKYEAQAKARKAPQ